MSVSLACLKELSIFEGLPIPALRKLAALFYTASYADGQLILLAGDTARPIFFVLNGSVRVYRIHPTGREQTLSRLQPGAELNLVTAFTPNAQAVANVQAVGATKLLLIAPDDFRRVATGSPEIALAVMRQLSHKLTHLVELTYDLSLRSVRGRLAHFLLEQATGESTAPLCWTQAEIAARIGSVRGVVNRTLRDFAAAGLIKLERQNITIKDLAALRAESHL
ncbi:MAG TPA: Crp/Fnr family transcriptional regulator [Thermoflexia bacterium]|nr:Crp/Fnr family transcriptional regulator [Thermoflexia bacterium]